MYVGSLVFEHELCRFYKAQRLKEHELNELNEFMKILELFSGTECLSDAFRARGHECFTVDWDRQFPSSLHCDIRNLTADYILEHFGQPDVIWGGFD